VPLLALSRCVFSEQPFEDTWSARNAGYNKLCKSSSSHRPSITVSVPPTPITPATSRFCRTVVV
jgi:hypothetical protein